MDKHMAGYIFRALFVVVTYLAGFLAAYRGHVGAAVFLVFWGTAMAVLGLVRAWQSMNRP